MTSSIACDVICSKYQLQNYLFYFTEYFFYCHILRSVDVTNDCHQFPVFCQMGYRWVYLETVQLVCVYQEYPVDVNTPMSSWPLYVYRNLLTVSFFFVALFKAKLISIEITFSSAKAIYFSLYCCQQKRFFLRSKSGKHWRL